MCAVMTVHSDDIEEITACVVECKRIGIDVLPPDINKSMPKFSLEDIDGSSKKAIRYGLSAIKGIGIAPAEEILKYRPFTSFDDYMAKIHDPTIKRFTDEGKKINCPLSKRNEPVLIYAGCFDDLNENRHKLINRYHEIRKDKDWVPLKDNYNRKLRLEYEKQHMGVYVSDHPLKNYPFVRWSEVEDGDTIELGGIIRKIDIISKNGKDYATGTLETLEDKRRFIVGGRVINKVRNKLKKDLRVVLVGIKNGQFDNINVSNIRLVVVNSKKQLEDIPDTVEIDPSLFTVDLPSGGENNG